MDGIMGQAFNLSEAVERQFMLDFISEAPFNVDVCRDQLRCLWTTYCLHYGLDVDTRSYDAILRKLYEKMSETEPETADWSDLESFGYFMCRHLV